MATRITTIEEFERVRADPANRGRAYEVPGAVFDEIVNQLSIHPVAPEEVAQLSEYLGTEVAHSPRIGLTRKAKCPHCGHDFSFVDHFKSAVESQTHSKDDLVEFTNGFRQGRHYVVIDTTDPIEVKCVNCGRVFMSPRCCYTTSSYAYA